MNAIERLICFIVGVSLRRLIECPEEERSYFYRLFVQIVGSFAFLALMVFLAVSVRVAPVDWPSTLFCAGCAIIVATLVTVVDTHLVIHHLQEAGRRASAESFPGRAHGFNDEVFPTLQRGPYGVQIPKRVMAGRVLLSVVMSGSFALFLDLRLFAPEISTKIDGWHAAANASLEQEMRAGVITEITEEAARVEEADAVLKRIEARRAALRDLFGAVRVSAVPDAELSELDKAYAAAAAERGAAAQKANLEREGVKFKDRTTGVAGCGAQCRMWASEVERLDGVLASLDERRRGLSARAAASAAAEDARVQQAKQEAERELAVLSKESERLTAVKEKASSALEARRTASVGEVTRRMMEDARYVPRRDGLAARFTALSEVVSENPKTLVVILLMSATILMLELNLVLSALLFAPRTIYAVKAEKEYRRSLFMVDRYREVEEARLNEGKPNGTRRGGRKPPALTDGREP